MTWLLKSAKTKKVRTVFIGFNYENCNKNWKRLYQNVALVTSYQNIYLTQNLGLTTFYQYNDFLYIEPG